jgi:hypothetical protein
MSITFQVWINCDNCGESFGADTVIKIGSVEHQKSELKASAIKNKWTSIAGKDLCPSCSQPNVKDQTAGALPVRQA